MKWFKTALATGAAMLAGCISVSADSGPAFCVGRTCGQYSILYMRDDGSYDARKLPSSFFTPFDPVKEPNSHRVSMYIACMSETECAKTTSECATSNGVPCIPLPWRKGWPDPCGIMRCESRIGLPLK